MDKDIYGNGLLAYLRGQKDAYFTVESDIAETEEWPVGVFFRTYDDMPEIEQIALSRSAGKILDVGAGAGSQALYLQQKGYDVTAIDISQGAVDVMKERGIKNVLLLDFYSLENEKFDTLLFLMNGIGIAGTIRNLPNFLQQAKSLLTSDGKILVDSSDLIYLFEEEDGSFYVDLNDKYYGELTYSFDFDNEKGERFPWLFIDFDTLQDIADLCGLSCEKIYEDDHYLFLAELKIKN